MTLYNDGTITVPSECDKALLIAMKLLDICLEDIITNNGQSVAFINIEGDIEDKLEELVEAFNDQDIPIEINITYSGDYDGMYVVNNGKLEDIDIEDMTIREANDEMLIKELEDRGYKVSK